MKITGVVPTGHPLKQAIACKLICLLFDHHLQEIKRHKYGGEWENSILILTVPYPYSIPFNVLLCPSR